jgi:sigma-B regulation protein RsbU (phosphoserine phosphatase)
LRGRSSRDLDLAARIQADLFPARMPRIPGYELAARNRPARSCGGDYYDALPLASGAAAGVLLCVADVAGKGLPAALVMSNMQATLRALLGRSESLPALAGHASELLYGSTSPEKYVTAAFAELTPASGALTFVGAGHLDNVVVRASGETTPLSSTGRPLGLLPLGPAYEETMHTLGTGDCLVLFSDGVTDAQDADGNEFGESRLIDVLRASAGLPAEALIGRVFAEIDAFVGSAPQFDDITMLVVRRAAAVEE